MSTMNVTFERSSFLALGSPVENLWVAKIVDGQGRVLAREEGSKPQTAAWRNGARQRMELAESISPYMRKWRSYSSMPMGTRAAHNRWCAGWDAMHLALVEEKEG